MAKILGISGLIGSGKSLISQTLEVLYSIPCFDSDSIAKELYFEKTVQIEIEKTLGFNPIKNGVLEKSQLKATLANPTQKTLLEHIIHSAVARLFVGWKKQQSSEWVALESAILFTSGFYRYCNFTVSICAPNVIRKQRVLQRDPERSEAEFDKIDQLQSEEGRKQREESDIIINNNGFVSITRAVESLKESITNI